MTIHCLLKTKLARADVRSLASSIIGTASHGAMAACVTFMCVWIVLLAAGVIWFKLVLY